MPTCVGVRRFRSSTWARVAYCDWLNQSTHGPGRSCGREGRRARWLYPAEPSPAFRSARPGAGRSCPTRAAGRLGELHALDAAEHERASPRPLRPLRVGEAFAPITGMAPPITRGGARRRGRRSAFVRLHEGAQGARPRAPRRRDARMLEVVDTIASSA